MTHDGQPTADQIVTVRYNQNDIGITNGQTQPDGSYVIMGVPLSAVSVEAYLSFPDDSRDATLQCLSRSVQIEDGKETTVDFDIIMGQAEIEGTILLNGQAPHFVKIWAKGKLNNGDMVNFSTYGDDKGYYRLTQLPEVDLELDVRAFPTADRSWNKRYTYTTTITTVDGQTSNLDIDLSD